MEENKEKYSLAFVDSPISSYPKISFAYSVLKANLVEEFEKIFSYQYILYYYDEDDTNNGFTFYPNDFWYSSELVTVFQEIELFKESYDALNFDLPCFVRTCSKSNMYIYGLCDRSVFDAGFGVCGKRAAVDYYLITGCDCVKKTVSVRYFDAEHCAKHVDVDFDTFERSVFRVPSEKVVFYMMKYNGADKLQFNNYRTALAFNAYVTSSDLAVERKTRNRTYGLQATKSLLGYFENRIRAKEPINKKYILCFHEHKELMVKRVKYLIEQKLLPAALLERAEFVNEIKNKLYEDVSKLMTKIIDTEEVYFKNIIDELQKEKS